MITEDVRDKKLGWAKKTEMEDKALGLHMIFW